MKPLTSTITNLSESLHNWEITDTYPRGIKAINTRRGWALTINVRCTRGARREILFMLTRRSQKELVLPYNGPQNRAAIRTALRALTDWADTLEILDQYLRLAHLGTVDRICIAGGVKSGEYRPVPFPICYKTDAGDIGIVGLVKGYRNALRLDLYTDALLPSVVLYTAILALAAAPDAGANSLAQSLTAHAIHARHRRDADAPKWAPYRLDNDADGDYLLYQGWATGNPVCRLDINVERNGSLDLILRVSDKAPLRETLYEPSEEMYAAAWDLLTNFDYGVPPLP